MTWYATYPRAAARPDAYRAWSKAVAKISADELLAKTTAFAEAHRRCGTEERFIPHPATWLNQERWNDRLPEPRAAPPSGHRANGQDIDWNAAMQRAAAREGIGS